jgi:hypothetical protein
MDELSSYLILIRGLVEESELNATSPLQAAVIEINATTTLLSVDTDQSGLVGLLRHLHGHGFVILSVNCK